MNLIINASDALGSQEGLIRITTGTMDVDRAFLDTCYPTDRPAEGVFAYLEVSDTGCGMDAETQKRIFEPFYTTKMTGRGLGLAAVLGIVRGHKGAIQFTSGPSHGTTFKVLFPVVESPPEESCGNGASRVHVAANGTVLVVDDDEMVRTVTRRIIEKFGFTVLLAVDGRDGVDVYREHQHEVSVVLLDMTMPRLNGEDAFREMRQINPDVRVILTSGYNETEVTDKFEGKELAGFIQKPYRAKELLQKLQAEIRGRGTIVTPSSNAVAQPHGSTP